MNWRYFQMMLGVGLLVFGMGSLMPPDGSPFGMLAGLTGFYLLARVFARDNTIEPETTTYDDESGQIERE
ncbi:MAG: hypothetical protein AAF787_21480 [Chloroflexota bacterium]